MFLSRNYRLLIILRKFNVFKRYILVLSTSIFKGPINISPIVPRHKEVVSALDWIERSGFELLLGTFSCVPRQDT